MLNICHLLFSFSFHIPYCGYALCLRTLPKKSTSGTRSKQSPAGIRATKQHQATPSFVGICTNRRVSPRASAVSSSASKRCPFSCTRRRTSNRRDVMALKRPYRAPRTARAVALGHYLACIGGRRRGFETNSVPVTYLPI